MDGSNINEDSRGDDMFANSSTETVVQNIDFSLILREAANLQSTQTPNSQEESCIVADPSYRAECFVSDVCNFPLQLHCPFCCKYFAFEHLLKEHIKLDHEKYWEMLRSDNHILLLHSCLFCHAKYYKKQVLLKHILYGHQEVVVAASQKHQLCPFCPYTTVAPSRSKLLHHVEQNHAKEFETLVDSMYIHNGKLENTMASSQNTFASFPSCSFQMTPPPPLNYNCDAEVLSPISKNGRTSRKRLRFDQPDVEQCKNIPAPCNRRSKWKTFLSFINLKKSRDDTVIPKFTTSTPKPLSDRKSLVDNDIYYLDYDGKKFKETSFNKIKKKRFLSNIFSRQKNKNNYRSLSNKRPSEIAITPTRIFKRNVNVCKPACGNTKRSTVGENGGIELSCKWAANDEYKIKQFKCAVCLDAFGDNVGLVCHVKRHHNGPLRLLQPSFKCGLCEATFYKNSFLLRHCKFHHTPLCLRS